MGTLTRLDQDERMHPLHIYENEGYYNQDESLNALLFRKSRYSELHPRSFLDFKLSKAQAPKIRPDTLAQYNMACQNALDFQKDFGQELKIIKHLSRFKELGEKSEREQRGFLGKMFKSRAQRDADKRKIDAAVFDIFEAHWWTTKRLLVVGNALLHYRDILRSGQEKGADFRWSTLYELPGDVGEGTRRLNEIFDEKRSRYVKAGHDLLHYGDRTSDGKNVNQHPAP